MSHAAWLIPLILGIFFLVAAIVYWVATKTFPRWNWVIFTLGLVLIIIAIPIYLLVGIGEDEKTVPCDSCSTCQFDFGGPLELPVDQAEIVSRSEVCLTHTIPAAPDDIIFTHLAALPE